MAGAELPPEDPVRTVLLQSTKSFRQLVSEHHQLDERIQQLASLRIHRPETVRRNLTQEKETGPQGSNRVDSAQAPHVAPPPGHARSTAGAAVPKA